MKISHYGFVCQVSFSNDNLYESRKRNIEKIKGGKIFQVFVKNSQIFPVPQILFLFLFACFEFQKLFLFLFEEKLFSQINSYFYSRKKKKNSLLNTDPNIFGCYIFTEQISKCIRTLEMTQIQIQIIFEGNFI